MSTPMSLPRILADPKNQKVSSKFFKFAFLLLVVPLGFLIFAIKYLDVVIAGVTAVVLVNVIVGIYAYGAYTEEVQDWKDHVAGPTKKGT